MGSEQFRAYTRRRGEQRAEQQIAVEDKAARPPIAIRDGEWLNAHTPPVLTWAVPRLIPEGVALVGGTVKMGKSWLTLGFSLTLSAGMPPLGSLDSGPQRPVLYLALEDSDRRMKDRCAVLGYEQVPPWFSYATDCRQDAVVDEIGTWIASRRGGRPVVIIDTWGRITAPALRGETTFDRDYRMSGEISAMVKSEPGATVIINCHTRKAPAEDWVEQISGTLGISAGVDTLLLLARRRGQADATLKVTGRDVDDGDYALAGFPRWALAGGTMEQAARAAVAQTARDGLGERQRAILDFIDGQGHASNAEIALRLGVTSDQASTYLGRLGRAGLLTKTRRGMWERQHHGGGGYDWPRLHAETYGTDQD